MSLRVYYYSRTGTCAKVAHTYTQNGQGEVVQIKDVPENRYWGFFGFIKGGYNTVRKKEISYKRVGDQVKTPSEIVFVMPVWAGQVPPTVRTFLMKENFEPGVKVTVITVSKSGKYEKTFSQTVEILEKKGIQEFHHRNLKEKEID
ncbi:MAG: hypothetical protein KAX49_05810 [Halanaerobiales bacterium]|nr:hypothetical protein [Halanaerobiales bacterium]